MSELIVTKDQVPKMLPDVIKSDPNVRYSVGACYDPVKECAEIMVYNKDTGSFEYHTRLFTTNNDHLLKFYDAIGEYFNTKILIEG